MNLHIKEDTTIKMAVYFLILAFERETSQVKSLKNTASCIAYLSPIEGFQC